MPIRELIWDDWNQEHVARHHITPEEVEDIGFGDYWEKRAGGLSMVKPVPAATCSSSAPIGVEACFTPSRLGT